MGAIPLHIAITYQPKSAHCTSPMNDSPPDDVTEVPTPTDDDRTTWPEIVERMEWLEVEVKVLHVMLNALSYSILHGATGREVGGGSDG